MNKCVSKWISNWNIWDPWCRLSNVNKWWEWKFCQQAETNPLNLSRMADKFTLVNRAWATGFIVHWKQLIRNPVCLILHFIDLFRFEICFTGLNCFFWHTVITLECHSAREDHDEINLEISCLRMLSNLEYLISFPCLFLSQRTLYFLFMTMVRKSEIEY